MHFMFTWYAEASPERLAEIDANIQKRLGDLPHARPFPQSYVVQVMGNGIYETAILSIHNWVKEQPETIQTLISPLLTRGLYHGRLKGDVVDRIHELSE